MEAGIRPTIETLEWVTKQEWQGHYHKFGAGHHQPNCWPDKYYSGSYLICPPQVKGREFFHFRHMVGYVYKFHGLDFAYLGKNRFAGAKAHWEPFPFPAREALGK
eukprot:561899-Heterocapsa_arctica.AAC.1